MIPIEKITEQELERRFSLLPNKLKDGLNSASLLQIVHDVSASHAIIDDERMLIIEQLVTLVFFGFLHTYDISDEINHALELNNKKLCDSIAAALDAKVFAPLKTELENNYAPLPSESPRPQSSPIASPKVFEEIKKPAVSGAPTSVVKAPAPQKISPLTIGGRGTPAPKMLSSEAMGSVVNNQRQTTSTAPIPPTSAKPMPPPLVLRQESKFEPLKAKQDIHIDIPLPPKASGAGNQPKPRVARVEIGIPQEQPAQPPVARTEPPTPRIVHYSQLKTPLDKPAPGEPASRAPAPVPLSHLVMRTPGTEEKTKPSTAAPRQSASGQSWVETRPEIPKPSATKPRTPVPIKRLVNYGETPAPQIQQSGETLKAGLSPSEKKREEQRTPPAIPRPAPAAPARKQPREEKPLLSPPTPPPTNPPRPASAAYSAEAASAAKAGKATADKREELILKEEKASSAKDGSSFGGTSQTPIPRPPESPTKPPLPRPMPPAPKAGPPPAENLPIPPTTKDGLIDLSDL